VTFADADERAHAPGTASWCEAWQLDAAGTDGIGCSVRLTLFPALGVAWWWTHLFLPDVTGAVVVRDHEVGLPRQGLEIRADGLWAELTCETPFEHWTYGLEAFGVRLDDAAESLQGEIGERMAVGLDIEWEVDPEVSAHASGLRDRVGYEQFGRVHGEVLLGRSRYELDAVGLRSHTWGAPHFDRATTSAWLRGPDLASSFTSSGDGVDGYLVRNGDVEPIATVRSETHRRADGLPVTSRYVVDDQLEIESEVLGLVAIPVGDEVGPRSTLSRAFCRYAVVDGAAPGNGGPGIGWSSWLDPE
jgi:hypothetical protein